MYLNQVLLLGKASLTCKYKHMAAPPWLEHHRLYLSFYFSLEHTDISADWQTMADKLLLCQLYTGDFSLNDGYCRGTKVFQAWGFVKQVQNASWKPIITGRMQKAILWFFTSGGHHQIHKKKYVLILNHTSLQFSGLRAAGLGMLKQRSRHFFKRTI